MDEGRRLEIGLEKAGLLLGGAAVSVAVPQPEQLRYNVPARTDLVVDAAGADWIQWSTSYTEWPGPLSPPPGKCLRAFLRLAEASSSQVLGFARAWGPLSAVEIVPHRIDEHEPPGTDLVRRSRLSDWKQVSMQLRALISAAADLQQGRPADHDDWSVVVDSLSGLGQFALANGFLLPEAASLTDYLRGFDIWDKPEPTNLGVVLEQRRLVALVVQRWIQRGPLELTPLWGIGESPFTVLLAPSRTSTPQPERLATIICIELAATLSSALSLVRCDECHYPYVRPKRRPKMGVAHYCPDCSEGHGVAAKRAWWRTHRSRR
jgi:hypothetical protein